MSRLPGGPVGPPGPKRVEADASNAGQSPRSGCSVPAS